MRYRKAYEWGKTRLEMSKIAEAALDARLLLEYVCQTNRNDLYSHSEMELSQKQEEQYEDMIKHRAEHIPLQHLTGEQEFMGLSFKVSGDVLIPRQDTEILAEEALIAVNDGDTILDLCTGSGCVLISVIRYKNDVCGIGTDISDKALEIARSNYDSHKNEINGKADFLQGDLFDALKEDYKDVKYDVIVSNPPYIPSNDIKELEPEVREHDPMLALDGGQDGLDFYRKIAKISPQYLASEGKLLLEIGYDQGEAVSQLLIDNGFTDVKVIKDLAGLDRVVRARREA